MSQAIFSLSATNATVGNTAKVSDKPSLVSTGLIDPHPRNPRLVQRDDVVSAIAGAISVSGFDPAHAVILRPVASRYQIVSGHHRVAAAKRAGIDCVPCWVREMDDDTAYMELIKANAQGELSALERGIHALHATEKGQHGRSIAAYAKQISGVVQVVQRGADAAEVYEEVTPRGVTCPLDKPRQLAEIHAAEEWLWPALVRALARDVLTVERTVALVRKLKDLPKKKWAFDWDKIGERVVTGQLKPTAPAEMLKLFDDYLAIARKEGESLDKRVSGPVDSILKDLNVASPSELESVVRPIIRKIEDKNAETRRKEEEANEKAVRLRANVSLKEWEGLDDGTRSALLDTTKTTASPHFNKQDSSEIEWAQWSWNPVTGCLHDCPYCYARDIAKSHRMAAAYPNGFTPTFRPNSLLAPRNTQVPPTAVADTRFKNVFTCSMADLFGRWVPEEWIKAVLGSVRESPQWNFLMLTKFPKRMSEFDIPNNAWMGTTVDLQARVKNAESAFSRVKAGIRWLSVEPMIEPLRFSRLDLFQWIVIGGSSPSTETPAWRPPFEWIADLVAQAREAGCRVYFKTNLLGDKDAPANRILELPFDAPVLRSPDHAPDVFHYLKRARENSTSMPELAA